MFCFLSNSCAENGCSEGCIVSLTLLSYCVVRAARLVLHCPFYRRTGSCPGSVEERVRGSLLMFWQRMSSDSYMKDFYSMGLVTLMWLVKWPLVLWLFPDQGPKFRKELSFTEEQRHGIHCLYMSVSRGKWKDIWHRTFDCVSVGSVLIRMLWLMDYFGI